MAQELRSGRKTVAAFGTMTPIFQAHFQTKVMTTQFPLFMALRLELRGLLHSQPVQTPAHDTSIRSQKFIMPSLLVAVQKALLTSLGRKAGDRPRQTP